MTHWDPSDKVFSSVEMGARAGSNNITLPGRRVSDSNPAGIKSRNMVEAHFKAMRCYRKF